MLFIGMQTLGLSELVLMPWAYFAKDKRTYLIEVVYNPGGAIVEWYPMQGVWKECANEADRALPGTHAMGEWRTYLHQCVNRSAGNTIASPEG